MDGFGVVANPLLSGVHRYDALATASLGKIWVDLKGGEH
jgi:hypothetical protein